MGRQWYRFYFDGKWWEVYATSPETARGNFLIWHVNDSTQNVVYPDWLRTIDEDND